MTPDKSAEHTTGQVSVAVMLCACICAITRPICGVSVVSFRPFIHTTGQQGHINEIRLPFFHTFSNSSFIIHPSFHHSTIWINLWARNTQAFFEGAPKCILRILTQYCLEYTIAKACRNYGTSAKNGTRKDFLGTPHSLLS